MTAEMPQRRKMTARQAAAWLGVHPRTVRKMVAEPRAEFVARAHARQDRARALLESGLTYRQVAETMGITRGTAAGLVHRARMRGKVHETEAA